jgi:hypothetical protein
MQDALGPIISGVAGAAVAGWVSIVLARWIPTVCNAKSAAVLLRENRPAIYAANGLFLLGLLGAIGLYKFGWLRVNDWRGLALGFGVGTLASALALPLFAMAAGRSPREAIVAYAISQMVPTALLYVLFALGIACFAAAAAGLVAG